MSLDLTLIKSQPTEVFEANLTHNLKEMADAAGIYKPIWRPEECGMKNAGDMIPILGDGLDKLREDPEKYKALEPKNKWGTYDKFVAWVERYLAACKEHPDAMIDT